MFRKPAFSITLTSIYLLVYLILLQVAVPLQLMLLLLAVSPFLLLWMFYTVLRYGKYTGTELKDDQEWGYEDRSKGDLATFF
jgi:hypothetical protein